MSSISSGSLWIVLSDIHANWAALESVVNDSQLEARKLGLRASEVHFASLGDVVDYGPDPGRCLEWVEANCEIKLRGNHDLEASRCPTATISRNRIARYYWPISFWTRCQLTQAHKETLRNWSTISDKVAGLAGFALAHSEFDDEPQKQEDQNLVVSLDEAHMALTYSSLFKPLLTTRAARYGIVGHSHEPGIIQSLRAGQCWLFDNGTPRKWLETSDGWKDLPPGNLVINPGGVGQPRWPKGDEKNGIAFDPRAQYLLLDTRQSGIRYKLRRVEYDIQAITRRLQSIIFPEPIPDGCKPSAGDESSPRMESSDLQCLKAELPMLCRCLGERLLRGKVDSCLDRPER